MNRDTQWIHLADLFSRISSVFDIRDLRSGKSYHVKILIVPVESVKVVEISSRRDDDNHIPLRQAILHSDLPSIMRPTNQPVRRQALFVLKSPGTISKKKSGGKNEIRVKVSRKQDVIQCGLSDNRDFKYLRIGAPTKLIGSRSV